MTDDGAGAPAGARIDSVAVAVPDEAPDANTSTAFRPLNVGKLTLALWMGMGNVVATDAGGVLAAEVVGEGLALPPPPPQPTARVLATNAGSANAEIRFIEVPWSFPAVVKYRSD